MYTKGELVCAKRKYSIYNMAKEKDIMYNKNCTNTRPSVVIIQF